MKTMFSIKRAILIAVALSVCLLLCLCACDRGNNPFAETDGSAVTDSDIPSAPATEAGSDTEPATAGVTDPEESTSEAPEVELPKVEFD